MEKSEKAFLRNSTSFFHTSNSWCYTIDNVIMMAFSWEAGNILSKGLFEQFIILSIFFHVAKDDIIPVIDGLRNFFQDHSTRNVLMHEFGILPSSQHLVKGQGMISEIP